MCRYQNLIHVLVSVFYLVLFQFDIIISEWMGYFLLFESMLDTVLYARDRFLKPNGIVLPDYCALYIAGLSDPSLHQRNVTYWNDVYGFKMSCMKSVVLKEASVMIVKESCVHTDYALLKVLTFILRVQRQPLVSRISELQNLAYH